MIDAVEVSRRHWDVLLIAFFAIALWESFRPRRIETRPTMGRWGRHAVLAAGSMLPGLLTRTSPVLLAVAIGESGFGLLNRLALASPVSFVAACLLLDLTRYLQHRLLHGTRLGWRLHRVHHSDEHFDLTTGFRFHPAEAVFTQGSYLAVVAVLGPPPVAVLVVELITVAQDFFAHANLRLPPGLERVMRLVWVTPELHRVHHSVAISEQNTNFATILPLWDRLFGTYLGEPRGGHDALRFGLQEIDAGTSLTVAELLTMPFRARPTPRSPSSVPSSTAG